jgi:hypothetical protein
MNNICFNSITDKFNIRFNPISRPLGTWRDEVIANAQYIRSMTDRDIAVALSGGIDGEVVCRAFLAANIHFKVLTVKHTAKTNDHDTRYADKFCREHDLEQIILDLDTEQFFTIDKERFVERGYHAHNLFRYLQLYIMSSAEDRGLTAVLGGGEQIYNAGGNEIYVKYHPDFTNSLRWCTDNQALHFPYFFQTTPEVTAAYIKHPLIKFMSQNPRYFESYSERYSAEKTLVYHEAWPEMERRTKFHGFEHLLEMYSREHKKMVERFPDVGNRITIPLSQVKQQLNIE